MRNISIKKSLIILSSLFSLGTLISSFIFNVNDNIENKFVYKDSLKDIKKSFITTNNLLSNEEPIAASNFITTDSGSGIVEGMISYEEDPSDPDTVDITGQEGVNVTNPTFLGNVTVPILGDKKQFSKVKILESSFADSEEITGKITFDDGIISIGESAFTSRSRLTSISLPKSLSSIGKYAFSGCPIKQVNFEGNDTYKWANNIGQGHLLSTSDKWDYRTAPIGCLAYGDIDMSKATDLSEIKANLFSNCAGVTSIDLSKCTSLTSIGTYAFYLCGLTSVSLPSSLATIGSYAFYNCKELKTLDLSSCTLLETIDDNVFMNCSGLTSLDLSKCESLKNINDGAFYGCTALTSLDLSNCTALTTIGDSAFKYCSGLSSISLPSSLTSIETNAFAGCTGVTSIKIPNTITSIQNGAFMTNVDKRTFLDSNINIYLNWNESDFNEFDFNNTLVWPVVYDNPTSPTKMFFPSKSTFYVPKGLRDVYLANKEKLGWDFSVGGLAYTVNDTQIKEYDPDNPGGKTTNLPLILGLSLGLGVPVVAGVTAGTILGIKKYNSNPKRKHKK